MAGRPAIAWPPHADLLAMRETMSLQAIADQLGCSRSVVGYQIRKAELGIEAYEPPKPPKTERAGVFEHDDGSASVVSDAVNQPPAPWKPEELLLAHGLDPAEWEIVRARGNRWGDPAEPSHQLRVDAVPRRMLIAVPDPGKWTPPPKPRKRRGRAPRKVVVCGDHHCPHHDPALHRLFLEWLAEERPDEGVINGDLLDFSTISRHRERDGFAQPVNEGLRAAFGVLRDYREASPDTRWTLKRGNHDDRLYHQVLDNVRGLHKIAAAGDEIPALSLQRLLHLDDLGVVLVDEDWDMAKIRLSPKLTIRHGPSTGRNVADKLLSKFSVSVIQGHTHRLSLGFRTEHTEDEGCPTETRMGAEAGCMCEIKDGLGYQTEANWQNGFMVAHVWPDGNFHVAPAVYIPGQLLAPGGRRYAA